MTMEQMEAKRNDIYLEYVAVLGQNLKREKELLDALNLMDEIMDAQEGYEEELEDENEAYNWDEWMLDNQIDMMREERMAYER